MIVTYKLLILMFFALFFVNNAFAEIAPNDEQKFPDRMMFRMGFYNVRDINTDVSVNSSSLGGLGTTISFEKDLGGSDNKGVPRIAAHYRFNDNHRLEFEWFEIKRTGLRTLDIDFTYEGQDYTNGSSVKSKFDTRTTKLGYGYSFYRSKKAELVFTAGLHILNYDISLEDSSNNLANSSDVSAPLPLIGLTMDYHISDRWKLVYKTQSFYIKIDNAVRGSLVDFELDTEYRFTKHFAVGLGFSRLTLDIDVSDSDFRGELTNLYRGYTLYFVAYL